MKIAYLASGAAGMYCGTCLHDNTLAAALLAAGEDVLLIPTYTPLRVDEEDVSQSRVFFGGINVYLQQKLSLFRHTPWFFDKLLDSPGLINWATGLNISIDPAQLGDLTRSMLEGEAGALRKETEKLVKWLAEEVKPDVVHLSNALLLASATDVRRHVRCVVTCGLSGEDVFVERIPEPHRSQVIGLMREHAKDVAAFTALNRYYADVMIDYIDLPPERVHVVRHGLNLAGHGPQPPRSDDIVRLGYFARQCPDKGLHQLAAAFELLAQDRELDRVQLHVAGYLSKEDKPYLADLEGRLRAAGLTNRYVNHGELDRTQKIRFLQSLDVMSVPTVYRESKGLSVLEAMANEVPVVLPSHGAFPELIADTGGGVLFPPGDVPVLAATLKQLLLDEPRARQLGQAGRAAIVDRYHATGMAQQTLTLYRQLSPKR